MSITDWGATPLLRLVDSIPRLTERKLFRSAALRAAAWATRPVQRRERGVEPATTASTSKRSGRQVARGTSSSVLRHSCTMSSDRVLNSTKPWRLARRSVRWAFRNRRTGHFTVVQWPNTSLVVYAVLLVLQHVFRPTGGIETLTRVLADVALFVWAIDELLRGVNPFRRALGPAVIIATSIAVALQMS